MPGISVSKICVPFGGGGIDWSSYWATRFPSGLTAVVASDTQINLSWTNNGTADYTGHKIYISTDAVTYTLKDTVLSIGTNYSATSLTLGTRYYFYVVAYKESSESAASNIVNALTLISTFLSSDGKTLGVYYPKDVASKRIDGSGNDEIYWDMLYGSTARGVELASGNTAAYTVYEITATQTDHFYTGCNVGDVFVLASGKALDFNNKVKQVTGNHLVQTNAAARPLNGLFNGVDEFMRTRFDANWTRPFMMYIVFKQKTFTNSDAVFDGIVANNCGKLIQRTTSPNLALYNNGGTITANDQMPLDTKCIVRAVFDAETTTQSHLQVNNTPIVDSACSPVTAKMNGLVLGASGDQISGFSNIDVEAIICRLSWDDAATQSIIYNYLNERCALGLTPI